MPNFPILKPKDIIRILLNLGFTEIRQKGSHKQLLKGNLRVTIPFHNKDLNIGTLKSILRQANLALNELNELLNRNQKKYEHFNVG